MPKKSPSNQPDEDARSFGTSPGAVSIPSQGASAADDSDAVPSTELDPNLAPSEPPPSSSPPKTRRSTAPPRTGPASGERLFAGKAYDGDTTLVSHGEHGALTREDLERALGRKFEDENEEPEGESDVAPVGPTEYVGAFGQPSERPAPKPKTAVTRADLERQIRELEAKLDAMIGQEADRAPRSEAARHDATEAERRLAGTDSAVRQWARAGMKNRDEDVDDFGHDPAYEARFRPAIDLLFTKYFRVTTLGAARVPSTGRCLVIANHSGGPLPYDGVMLRAAMRREHPNARSLRWLAEDFIYYLPFAGAMMNRLGAVRACQENAERLLSHENLVAVFPEGEKGIGKLYRDRYKLQRFGRGGFIRLALRTRTPIVPAAIVGAEEANPLLYRLETAAKALGVPYLPVTPTFPALGPLGLMPAPTKWTIEFGEPMRFDEYGPNGANDEVLVGRLATQVRSTIQGMLDRLVAARRSIWFG